jgi:hypothetical protein
VTGPSEWALELAQAVERSICTPGPRPDSAVVRAHAEALDAAELRGHTRAVESTAIASIHKAVAAERAAVVKWLRRVANVGRVATADDYADEIEAGDHHKETKP